MESTVRARPVARIQRLPRWLVGDWTPLVRDPVDLMRLALLVGALVTLAAGPREQSFRLLLTFVLTLIPRAIDAPRPFDLAFVAAMWFQAWGNVFGAFDHLHGYDKVVHFVLPCATAALTYLLLVRLRIVPDLEEERGVHSRAAVLVLVAALGLSFGGALYELYEWFADHYLGAHLYVAYGDSIGDLTDDGLGALFGGALILAWDRYGWGTRRRARAGAGSDPVAAVGDRVAERLDPEERAGSERREPPRLPRWLSGDWRGPVRDPIGILRLSFAAGAVAAAVTGHPGYALDLAVSFVAVALVRLLDVPRPFDVVFVVAMAVDACVGGGHVLTSAAAGPVLYVALIRFRVVPDLSKRSGIHERAAVALVGFSLGLSAGVLYEQYVFLANHVLDAGFQVDYPTFIHRLALDALGALAGAGLLVVWDSFGWGTERLPGRAFRRA